MIKDFELNESVTVFAAVWRRDIKEHNNITYISLEFGDASGRIPGVWWEPERYAVDELEEGDIVKVRGVVGEYRGKKQIRVNRMRPAKADEFDLADILPRSKYSDNDLGAKIISLTERVEDGFVKALMKSFWDNETFIKAYIRAAAGKLWHHAYIGGLAEHSINVAEICLDLSGRYSFLDRDQLIFGGLFHDMGKISQYSITSYIDYSTEGRLVGHINDADHLVATHAEQIDSFPPGLLIKLRHLLLAHHGQREFGSPVVPQTPEAFILNFADEIDSKMGAIDRIRQRTETGWSEYVRLLDRMLYFGEEEE